MTSTAARLVALLVCSDWTLSLSQPVRSLDAERWMEDTLGKFRAVSIVGNEDTSYALYTIESTEQQLAVQASTHSLTDGAEGEALSLKAMAETHSVKVPELIHYDGGATSSYIILEHLPDTTRIGVQHAKAFGQRMAELHLAEPSSEVEQPQSFGFSAPTSLVSELQPNDWTDDWVEFFLENRLNHQMYIAQQRQAIPALDYYVAEEWNALLQATGQLRAFFQGIKVKS